MSFLNRLNVATCFFRSSTNSGRTYHDQPSDTISLNIDLDETQIYTEISVTSQTPLIDPDRFSMKLSIYDVIGNQVITTAMPQKGKGFSFVWNGYNKNMRIVGIGVYPAIITITENNSRKTTKRIKIGVKR
jgi:hypothetical protein